MAIHGFSAGKWKFSRYNELETRVSNHVDTIMFVCEPVDEGDVLQQLVINNENDKHLIEAAPELYRVLEEILAMPVTGNIRSMKQKIKGVLNIADTGTLSQETW